MIFHFIFQFLFNVIIFKARFLAKFNNKNFIHYHVIMYANLINFLMRHFYILILIIKNEDIQVIIFIIQFNYLYLVYNIFYLNYNHY